MNQGEQVVAVLGQEVTNLNHSQCSNPSRPLFNVLPILSVPPNATSDTLRVDGECHFYRGPSCKAHCNDHVTEVYETEQPAYIAK